MLAAESGIDWGTILQQGGPWAVVVGLIVWGKLVPGPSHDRIIKDNEELKVRLHHLEELVEKQVIPAMVRYSDSLARRVDSP